MKNALITPKSTNRSSLRILSVLVLAAIMGTVTISSAKADWNDHGHGHGPEWKHRGWDEHAHAAYRYHHPVHVVRDEPGYVYAPPVVYAPPPPSGINLILPLHFN